MAGHLILTVVAICGIAGAELTLGLFHYEQRKIPFLDLTLGEWLYDLDVGAGSVVIAIGFAKGLITLWKAK